MRHSGQSLPWTNGVEIIARKEMQVSKICQACNGMGTLRVMQIDKTPTDSECKICYSKGEYVNFRHPPRCPNCGNKRFVPLVFGDHGRTFNCPVCKYTQRFIVAQGGWLKHGSTTIKKKPTVEKQNIIIGEITKLIEKLYDLTGWKIEFNIKDPKHKKKPTMEEKIKVAGMRYGKTPDITKMLNETLNEIKDAIEWRETYCRVDFYCTNDIQPNWIQVSILSDDGILLGNGPTELDAILDAYRAYIENK